VPIDTFEHSFVVDAPAEVVYRHLSDPNSCAGLSPLVDEVRDIRLGQDDDGRSIIAYIAVRRFRKERLLGWHHGIHVVTTLTRPGRELVSDMIGPARCRLRDLVELTDGPAGTRVTETVEVSAPTPLRRLVLDQARAAQLQRAEELTRRMARSTTWPA
jgi:hypothetical protein